MSAAEIELDEKQTLHALTLPPMSLESFCQWSGKCPKTLYRWQEEGLIKTVNIHGRQYISAREIMRFNLRVEAGEFAKTVKRTPPVTGISSAQRPQR